MAGLTRRQGPLRPHALLELEGVGRASGQARRGHPSCHSRPTKEESQRNLRGIRKRGAADRCHGGRSRSHGRPIQAAGSRARSRLPNTARGRGQQRGGRMLSTGRAPPRGAAGGEPERWCIATGGARAEAGEVPCSPVRPYIHKHLNACTVRFVSSCDPQPCRAICVIYWWQELARLEAQKAKVERRLGRASRTNSLDVETMNRALSTLGNQPVVPTATTVVASEEAS